ncbi:hypothetical protein JFT44_14785 [Pseudomonas sp. MF5691]|nr:hypothetical protein [Pseudomonas sp. MF5691]MBM6446139.1 hypothetical protein [Pseudomonas sp. MIL9]
MEFTQEGPVSSSSAYHPGPVEPTPQQRLLLMDDVQWESFIERCARQLEKEGQYAQVLKLGGANDKGRDICGYTVHPPASDTWDLYQAKYYSSTLSPSQIVGELAKFLSCVQDGSYTCPRRYYLCALRIGATLLDYLLNPESMRTWILAQWEEKKGEFGTFKRSLDPALKLFVQTFPFEIIGRSTPEELLEIHSRNQTQHWEHFGVLDARGSNPQMPEEPDPIEQRYVDALLLVYEEQCGNCVAVVPEIPRNLKRHFVAQRRLFYSAEGLNRFSRDKLSGAFDGLLTEVEIGIGGIVATPHDSGMIRLTETLAIANALQVVNNPLHARLQAGDLQGACHHLANQARLSWIDTDE